MHGYYLIHSVDICAIFEQQMDNWLAILLASNMKRSEPILNEEPQKRADVSQR